MTLSWNVCKQHKQEERRGQSSTIDCIVGWIKRSESTEGKMISGFIKDITELVVAIYPKSQNQQNW